MAWQFINRVGLEMEGNWKLDALPAGLGTDQSVRCPREYQRTHKPGEIRSPLLDQKDIEPWIMSNFPHITHPSCGFHVHVSFKDVKHYLLLMEKGFWRYYRSEMRKFGHRMKCNDSDRLLFFDRYDGTNQFCKPNFMPDEQIANVNSNRYTQLNFNAWHRHKTLENRLFPMFSDPKIATLAVLNYLNIIEGYLTKTTPIEDKMTTSLEVDLDETD